MTQETPIVEQKLEIVSWVYVDRDIVGSVEWNPAKCKYVAIMSSNYSKKQWITGDNADPRIYKQYLAAGEALEAKRLEWETRHPNGPAKI